MSANADDQSKQDALDAGMDYFITKPFAYKDLAKLLSKYRECKNIVAQAAIQALEEHDYGHLY
jgi:CheY-like chemotaxis protein